MKIYHRISIPFDHEIIIYLDENYDAKPYYWVIQAEEKLLLDSRHFNLRYEEVFLAVGDALDFARSQSYGDCNMDYPPDLHAAFIDHCNEQRYWSLHAHVIFDRKNL